MKKREENLNKRTVANRIFIMVRRAVSLLQCGTATQTQTLPGNSPNLNFVNTNQTILIISSSLTVTPTNHKPTSIISNFSTGLEDLPIHQPCGYENLSRFTSFPHELIHLFATTHLTYSYPSTS